MVPDSGDSKILFPAKSNEIFYAIMESKKLRNGRQLFVHSLLGLDDLIFI